MADYRTRNRDTSIFSDDRPDDHWRDQTRSRAWRDEQDNWSRDGQSDRGFFERAGDEVRSWFGDEDAERRRERDARENETQHWDQSGSNPDRYSRSRYPSASRAYYGERSGAGEGGFASGMSGQRGFGRSQPGSRESGFERGASDRFTGHQDDSYRRWRDEQIASLDREYDEYCRHRQQQFEQDFSNFRQNREGIASGGATLGRTGGSDDASDVVTRAAAARSTAGQDAASLSTGAETVATGDTQSGARAVRKN